MTPTRRGMLFVLSSPSGAGKTTLSRELLVKREPSVVMSVSVTTRAPRPGEIDGKDYYFVTEEIFDGMVNRGELLEHARVFDHYYGTPKVKVEKHLSAGDDVLFDIDWQGTQQLRARAREDLVSVFILPPSMKELERRLRSRAQDDEAVVQKRMSKAASEISHWEEYDYVLVNDDLNKTLDTIEQILETERLKRHRQSWLKGFVSAL